MTSAWLVKAGSKYTRSLEYSYALAEVEMWLACYTASTVFLGQATASLVSLTQARLRLVIPVFNRRCSLENCISGLNTSKDSAIGVFYFPTARLTTNMTE